MASTLACLGLAVASLDELNEHLGAMSSQVVGRSGGLETVRYADESGARVVVTVDEAGETLDLVPSYDARPGALLTGFGRLGGAAGGVVAADVVEEDGELLTRLAVDLEQRAHVAGPVGARVRASVVALGVEMAGYADVAAFDASGASSLGSGDGDGPRMGAESFVSYGLFTVEGEPEPTAYLAGTVLETSPRTHGVTGQSFHVARVRTAGFEATVCLAGDTDAPVVGGLVAGSCYLVVDAPTLWVLEPPRRRRRRR